MSFSEPNNLPPVLHEENLTRFKFLFNGELHDGLSFQNELFCRVYSVPAENRAQLYQYACQLSCHETVLTAADTFYSLWVSLRSPKAALHIAKKIPIPKPIEAVSGCN